MLALVPCFLLVFSFSSFGTEWFLLLLCFAWLFSLLSLSPPSPSMNIMILSFYPPLYIYLSYFLPLPLILVYSGKFLCCCLSSFDEGQITHLICARLKYDLYDFLGGVLGLLPVLFLVKKAQKHPPKKSYRSYFRRAQIRWVIWPSSIIITSSEIPPVLLGIAWPALRGPLRIQIWKKRRPQPYCGGKSSGNALEASNALKYRVWGIPAVLSREIPGNALRAFPGSFRNFSGISSGKSQPYWGCGPTLLRLN